MKDFYEVLQQKEADVANIRREIQSLKLVSSLLSDELVLKDARELLRKKKQMLLVFATKLRTSKLSSLYFWKN